MNETTRFVYPYILVDGVNIIGECRNYQEARDMGQEWIEEQALNLYRSIESL